MDKLRLANSFLSASGCNPIGSEDSYRKGLSDAASSKSWREKRIAIATSWTVLLLLEECSDSCAKEGADMLGHGTEVFRVLLA